MVLDDAIDSPNGVQQSVRTLTGWLEREGHEVRYFAGSAADGECDGRPVYGLARTVSVPFNGNRVDTPVVPRRLSAQGADWLKRCNVMHIQAPFGPMVGGRLLRGCSESVGVVASFHMAPLHPGVTIGARMLSRGLRREVMRVDRVTCDSPASESFMRQVWRRRGVLVPNPIDLEGWSQSSAKECESRTERENVRVAFLGRLVARKGCADLIQSVHRLPRALRDRCEVHIGGVGPEERRLRQLADDLGLERVVTFAGFIPEEEKAAFLASNNLLVLPAHGGESFGMSVVEGVAAGVPVLAYDNPGYGYVLRNATEGLTEAGDVVALSRALGRLVASERSRGDLLASERAAVREYDIGVVGARYLEEYSAARTSRSSSG